MDAFVIHGGQRLRGRVRIQGSKNAALPLMTVAILTDGDVVFQPHKIERSGIGAAVQGRVMIYIHKEQELADVVKRYPADRYVLVDDKVRILASVKEQWGSRATTVFPRQGHYALDAELVSQYPPPDYEIDHIGSLLDWDKMTENESSGE